MSKRNIFIFMLLTLIVTLSVKSCSNIPSSQQEEKLIEGDSQKLFEDVQILSDELFELEIVNHTSKTKEMIENFNNKYKNNFFNLKGTVVAIDVDRKIFGYSVLKEKSLLDLFIEQNFDALVIVPNESDIKKIYQVYKNNNQINIHFKAKFNKLMYDTKDNEKTSSNITVVLTFLEFATEDTTSSEKKNLNSAQVKVNQNSSTLAQFFL